MGARSWPAGLQTGRAIRRCPESDILHLDGFDLRAAPLTERKRVLAEFLKDAKVGPIVFSADLEGTAIGWVFASIDIPFLNHRHKWPCLSQLSAIQEHLTLAAARV